MNQLFNLKFTQGAYAKPKSGSSAVLAFYDESSSKETFIKKIKSAYGVQLTVEIVDAVKSGMSGVSITADKKNVSRLWIDKYSSEKEFTSNYFRNFLTTVIRRCSDLKVNQLHIDVPVYSSMKKTFTSEKHYYSSLVEGIYYGNYKFNKYLTKETKSQSLTVNLSSASPALMKSVLAESKKVMSAVKFVRDLQNEPGNVLFPSEFAKRITKTFAGTGVKVTLFNERKLEALKMGGLLAVGSGSSHPPCMLVLEYKPSKSVKHVALVGKGITFDSGGISIKPSADMGEMKGDMSGAAVASGVLLAASELKLPYTITAVLPLAENLPSGTAFRPGDIVTTSSGKTIEVDNTDAEGRVVLADALHFACSKKPDEIIDLATLTGAVVVALGEFTAGVFTKNEKLSELLYLSGMETYERVWPMPMWDDFNSIISSSVADVKNVGRRWGSAITAAKFLENWVSKDIPWAHIDIAGPAMPNDSCAYTKTYMTGFGVRLLINYLEKYSAKV